MKLRLTSKSVRLRLLRSDVQKIVESGRIEDTICFGPAASLTFALVIDPETDRPELRHSTSELAIVLPKATAQAWAETEQVGIYASADVGTGIPLDLIVEKDFACLDLSDAENIDTFPHPEPAAKC